MAIQVTGDRMFLPGSETVIEGAAPEGPFQAVFEDDGATGYFYAIDTSQGSEPIRDALHIYNVSDVTDRDKESSVKIGWSRDSRKAVLLINGYPHAIFDFDAREGWCRTGFPPPPSNGEWSLRGHHWNDEAINLFE